MDESNQFQEDMNVLMGALRLAAPELGRAALPSGPPESLQDLVDAARQIGELYESVDYVDVGYHMSIRSAPNVKLYTDQTRWVVATVVEGNSEGWYVDVHRMYMPDEKGNRPYETILSCKLFSREDAHDFGADLARYLNGAL